MAHVTTTTLRPLHDRVTDGGRRLPLAVRTGDHILFCEYSGSEVTLDGEEYLVMKEEDILGILGS